MKLGVMNNPYSDLLTEIEWIAENGFDFIDLALEAPMAALETTDWQAIQSALADSGLGVICHAAPYLPVNNPSPPVRQAALDELRRSVDIAQRLGATLLTTRFLGWPAHMADAAGYEYTKQLYSILIEHGAEKSVQIALENSPRNAHQLKYFREIFHRLPELLLLYDIGHGNVLTTAQHTTRDYLFALREKLIHLHLSDNDGQSNGHLPLGAPASGGIDIEREIRTLRSFGYDGTMTLQIFGDRRFLLESANLWRNLWHKE